MLSAPKFEGTALDIRLTLFAFLNAVGDNLMIELTLLRITVNIVFVVSYTSPDYLNLVRVHGNLLMIGQYLQLVGLYGLSIQCFKCCVKIYTKYNIKSILLRLTGYRSGIL